MKKSVLGFVLIIKLTFILSAGLILSGCGTKGELIQDEWAIADADQVQTLQTTSALEKRDTHIRYIKPEEVKRLLKEGNERYIRGASIINDTSEGRRRELSEGQNPFAIVVSCSDSRVVPEEIFDQGLGDLFVIRVAGNVISPVELGSIEYAVEHLKTPLIMVLGHEQCGAVTAAVEGGELPGSMGAIAERIKPAVAQVGAIANKEEAVSRCVELNVLNALKEIRQSPIVQHALENNLKLYGGIYKLAAGKVEWLDESGKE